MPQLKTLHLEPVAEDSLCPEALFTLGKDIEDLCILGEDPCHPLSLAACSKRGCASSECYTTSLQPQARCGQKRCAPKLCILG